MNREILFRGKRVDNGEWIYGFFVKDEKDAYILDSPADFSYGDNGNRLRIGCFKKVDLATIGQYIGLTDKNNVKIFEGDVVLVHDALLPCIHKIIEIDGMFHYRWIDYDVTIIGNIHDNPELMEVK